MSTATIATGATLYLAFELGWTSWKLAFTTGLGQKPRLRTIPARDLEAVRREIKAALERFDLQDDTPVVSCYEAGRDGFWLHRFLHQDGIGNVIVDSASIEISRRKKRPKTDRIDATKLVAMLVRHHLGEKLWSVVQVPTEGAEDARHLHRELKALKGEATRCVNRIKGLLANHGLALETVTDDFPRWLGEARRWDDTPVPSGAGQRMMLEFYRLQLVRAQITDLGTERRRHLRAAATDDARKAQKLQRVKGIGDNGAWVISVELLAAKTFANRKQVASMAGLTPTPYSSGLSPREQGIDKAGNRWVRAVLIELAWGWLRFQPRSALTLWYNERFAAGSKRIRKIGIVALARKLLVALWHWVEHDRVPAGAVVAA
jgi:transposase